MGLLGKLAGLGAKAAGLGIAKRTAGKALGVARGAVGKTAGLARGPGSGMVKAGGGLAQRMMGGRGKKKVPPRAPAR